MNLRWHLRNLVVNILTGFFVAMLVFLPALFLEGLGWVHFARLGFTNCFLLAFALGALIRVRLGKLPFYAWNCFWNWKKWRKAAAISKAAAILTNEGHPLGIPLMDLQTKLWKEIHHE